MLASENSQAYCQEFDIGFVGDRCSDAVVDDARRLRAAINWFHDFVTVDASMAVLGEGLQGTLLARLNEALRGEGGE